VGAALALLPGVYVLGDVEGAWMLASVLVLTAAIAAGAAMRCR
jgi:pyruvate/2-oxoglutarate dehydrogenase complex dihydrolipoamide dehydrogenase (E3) component